MSSDPLKYGDRPICTTDIACPHLGGPDLAKHEHILNFLSLDLNLSQPASLHRQLRGSHRTR